MDLHPFRQNNPGVGGRELKTKTKDLALVSIYAALYAVLVYLFAPISYNALQFRFAGVIRPAIAKKWILSIGYAMGVVVANLFSPYVGPYELVFMPLVSLIAGLAGYAAAHKFNGNYFICGAVIATIVPIGVTVMLYQLFGLPIPVTFAYLLVSEQIVCLIGASLFTLIDKRYKWWK